MFQYLKLSHNEMRCPLGDGDNQKKLEKIICHRSMGFYCVVCNEVHV